VTEHGGALSTQREVALVEVLDRALGAGVVITGDITISLADVELVYLNLRLLVSSVGTLLGESADNVSQRGLILDPGGSE
jgi:hypothetical protein